MNTFRVGGQGLIGRPDLHYQGDIDDARVYLRALSSQEVQLLYALRITPDAGAWDAGTSDAGTTDAGTGDGGSDDGGTGGRTATLTLGCGCSQSSGPLLLLGLLACGRTTRRGVRRS